MSLLRLIILLGIVLAFSGRAYGEIFSQVFGQAKGEEQFELPLYEGGQFIGEVEVKIQGEQLLGVSKKDLVIALRDVLVFDSYKLLLQLEGPWIGVENELLGFVYDPRELRLLLDIAPDNRRPREIVLQRYGRTFESARAKRPAPYSGALTTRAERIFSTGVELGPSFTRSQFDAFFNVQGVVLEGEAQYNSSEEEQWYRGHTRLVYDDDRHLIRYQAGDVITQSIGTLPFRQVGGINIARNFTLDPYRTNLPSTAQEFTLTESSRVSTFVNGALVRTEYLQAGRYSLSGIPLNNGLNSIRIEALDDSGRLQVFEFQQTSSLQLLHEGESRFDLTIGSEVIEQNRERRYLTEEDLIFSGFYQYGLGPKLTAGAYAQNQGDFRLYGSEVAMASPIGLFSVGAARGENDQRGGGYYALLYQLNRIGRQWHQNAQFNLSVEHRDASFQTGPQALRNLVATQWRAQLTLSPLRNLSTTLGGSLAELRDDLPNRKSLDLGTNIRLSSRASLSAYASRRWDEFSQRSDQIYAFLSLSFPTSGHYVQGSYTSPQQSKRLTVSNDRRQKIKSLRAQGSIEDNQQSREGELDLRFTHQSIELGVRGLGRRYHDERGSQERYTLSAASTLAFAVDERGAAFEISRPLAGSFALFKADDYEGPLDIRGLGMHREGIKGPLGHSLYPNLIPYQYRELRLDSTDLGPGQSFAREYYLIYPRYRSGHLIHVEVTGSFALKGLLLDEQGLPLPLISGTLLRESDEEERLFFTNRQGQFFIDGLKEAKYIVDVKGRKVALDLSQSSPHEGIFDIGELQMNQREGSSL